MTREMFVSATPHETRVGLVEDDQLAEVYLERENEYTLAGSIYKGRVTRVLPGMQSAFVDIGLERDAFLYVSDFMELENQEDDLDEVPTTVSPAERAVEAQAAPRAPVPQTEGGAPAEPVVETTQSASSSQEAREERGGWRGRRRRRGRRDRGSNGHDRSPRGRELESRPERARVAAT